MKISSLTIRNFRGITNLEMNDLGDTIIVAGPNGSGKSCIFDAIRWLKSMYGGYQQNEMQQFFGEFSIQLRGEGAVIDRLFNDITKEMLIEVNFEMRSDERSYISNNSETLLEESIWRTILPEAFQYGSYRNAMFANQFRERRPEVLKLVKKHLPTLKKQLADPYLIGKISIKPGKNLDIKESRALNVIFTNYLPQHLGVIDFHGPQRNYGRELVQGINLSLDQQTDKYSQHTLYNYNNKYNNVKSEMAGSFIKDILADKASDGKIEQNHSLSETLKELFSSFFPDKTFLGPVPTSDGNLSFPVKTKNGTEHDLDELSSGEKEILYGYLRIRKSAPKNSIILLDEPELHLNPMLIRGLPDFYRKHLGENLKNQLWLITHSDALIREAVGKKGFDVFHMLPCGSVGETDSQLRRLTVTEDLEVAIAGLVGDLAAYRPGGKGLIFEGGGDSDFDKHFVSELFSEELSEFNLISGTNKFKVKTLHEILDTSYQKGDLPTKYYAIVDRDSDSQTPERDGLKIFSWDVYHIENYLLDIEIICDVLNSMTHKREYNSPKVNRLLTESARDVIPSVVKHRLTQYVSERMVSAIDLRFDKNAHNVGEELFSAVSRSFDRLNKLNTSTLSFDEIKSRENEISIEVNNYFSNGTALVELPGRDILKRFTDTVKLGVSYEIFRNMIVSRMVDLGKKPDGMRNIIDKISKD